MNKNRLSIVISMQPAQFEAVAYKGNLEANLAKLKERGYDGVELAIRDPDQIDAGRLVRLLGESGLSVSAIGTGQAWGEERLSFTSPAPEVRKAAIGRIKKHIILAGQLKALVVIGLVRGVTPKEISRAQSLRYLVDGLAECTEFARQSGVRLALEPINRYETNLVNTVAEGLELLERVRSDHLGMLLDTFHMNIEEIGIEDSIRSCGKRIFHFHVADSNRRHPGGGHLNFKSILKALRGIDYQGWISGEFLPYPDADTAAKNSISYLRSIFSK